MGSCLSTHRPRPPTPASDEEEEDPYPKRYNPVMTDKIKLHKPDDLNGLVLCDRYIPEEIVTLILSYVEPKQLLRISRVCIKWHEIIKNYIIWTNIYERTYGYVDYQIEGISWFLFYSFFTTHFWERDMWQVRHDNPEHSQIRYIHDRPEPNVRHVPTGFKIHRKADNTYQTYLVRSSQLPVEYRGSLFHNRLFNCLLANFNISMCFVKVYSGKFRCDRQQIYLDYLDNDNTQPTGLTQQQRRRTLRELLGLKKMDDTPTEPEKPGRLFTGQVYRVYFDFLSV